MRAGPETRAGRAAMALALVVVASTACAETAAAQARLTGTYVRYLNVGPNGSMVSGMESTRYGEAAGPPASCDLYYPGAPVEGFTVEATGSSGTFVQTNGAFGGTITTTSGPTVSGRTIRWVGRATSGSDAITIEQTHAFEAADRFVRLTIVLTNAGTTPLTNVYYLRNGDPDHGSCDIGFDTSTDNDVRRQPPTDDAALVTAGGGDGVGTGRYIVHGIGAHDPRARVHAGGFENTDASGEWTAPSDPGGLSGDIGVDIVFREASLAAGASTTFEILYVWGTSVAEVETRFDELGFPAAPCVGVVEGGACTTSRGATGLCRSGRCCTGCWDGMRCRGGTSGTQCGVGGAACASCADGDDCTSDTCTTGVCSNPTAPAGTSCDDALFCTSVDTCNATGACVGGGPPRCDDMQSCTADTCDEATDACAFMPIAGCIIGGACVGEGTVHVGYPCLHCDPAVNPSDWSPRPAGIECGAARCSAGRLFPAGSCNATGTCAPAPSMPCVSGACADATTCETTCADTGCPDGEWCAPMGACMPLLVAGEVCVSDGSCATGACVDGVCCDLACDGTCEACNVEGSAGTCTPSPAGTDPDMECPLSCDGAGACEMIDAGAAPEDGGAIPEDDAGSPMADAGASPIDAGTTPPPDGGGCGCAVPRGGNAPGALALLAMLALALARRRRAR